ncbi:MAG: L-fuconolactonase, partial [Pseudonocardia sp.]
MTLKSGRIDAHHHFWDPARDVYPWMAGDAMEPVRRPFSPADLAAELGPAGVAGSVLVQTVSDAAETREF